MSKATLKDITSKIGSGSTPTGGENAYYDNGIALIRSQNVLDFRFSTDGLAYINDAQAKVLNNVSVKSNDILLNITGDSIARVCMVPEKILPARVNQHVAIIRCNEDVSSHYVFYYLQYLKPYLLKICGVGGTRNALTKEALEKLQIILNDNQEGRAIILSSLDSKVELNNRIIAELEALVKTIYNYWFVQFDFPNLKGKPYKASGGKMIWNEELKKETPYGWDVKNISTLFDYLEGPGITKDKYTKNGHNFININCIKNDDLDISNASMIKEEYIKNYSHFLLQEKDIVISTSGTLGRTAIVRKEHLPLLLNTSVIRFRTKSPYYFEYMYSYLKSEYFQKNLIKRATGSIQKNFGPTHLNEFKEAFPTKEITIQFQKITNSSIEKLIQLKAQNEELIHLRNWLLPMLMNGKVKVRNVKMREAEVI